MSSFLTSNLPFFFSWFSSIHGSWCLQHQHASQCASSFFFFQQCWLWLLGCMLLVFFFWIVLIIILGVWCFLHHSWCLGSSNVHAFPFPTFFFLFLLFFFKYLIYLWFHVCKCSLTYFFLLQIFFNVSACDFTSLNYIFSFHVIGFIIVSYFHNCFNF